MALFRYFCIIKKYLCLFDSEQQEKANLTLDLELCAVVYQENLILLESEI